MCGGRASFQLNHSWDFVKNFWCFLRASSSLMKCATAPAATDEISNQLLSVSNTKSASFIKNPPSSSVRNAARLKHFPGSKVILKHLETQLRVELKVLWADFMLLSSKCELVWAGSLRSKQEDWIESKHQNFPWSGLWCLGASNKQTGHYILICRHSGLTPALISSALLWVETQAISLLRAEMLRAVIQQRLLQPLLPRVYGISPGLSGCCCKESSCYLSDQLYTSLPCYNQTNAL